MVSRFGEGHVLGAFMKPYGLAKIGTLGHNLVEVLLTMTLLGTHLTRHLEVK